MDRAFLGMISLNGEDPPLDLKFEGLKALCGKHQEGPTPGSATWDMVDVIVVLI